MTNSYQKAGVNIEAGYESVKRMSQHVKRTERQGVMGALGGFGGLFDLSSLGLSEPVLVSGTDGVGTKLKLAFMLDRHDTIGIDCVAMCVNDIVVQGAEPLFFLDYIACGKAVPEKIENLVKGVADGCQQAGCALIGGETAEMPGLYEENEYDIAGFSVGACEKKELITGKAIQRGDVLIGLSSSGLHSNGYSLVRKILFEDHSYSPKENIAELGNELGDVLLTPTKIYATSVLAAKKIFSIHGMAHITGGGFIENLPRMLPKGLGVEIVDGSWEVPAIFPFLQKLGNLTKEEMYNVFNMGIGFVLAVPAEEAEHLVEFFAGRGENATIIGKVNESEGVIFCGQ
ncbi:phosphoribosylformylglycinamidine cyclo-ligase [Bacillus sp. 2205SS5-2]|uniref:phosphoribosylformylglycinamidine cyclo-ligase n=1 Tax=Bacillus sp. 2205SS5-2 TaxID=3109031 RepID=UPI00300472D7